MSYRIAMVGACPYPAPQGSQVLLRETARALQSAGHEVHLVVYGFGAAVAGWDADGIAIHRCAQVPLARKTAAGPSVLKPALDLTLTHTLRGVVRRHAIDLVHAHNYEGLLVALAAGKRPIVYHAHNVMADELPHFLRLPGAAAFGAWLDRTFPRRADHVIAPHERLAEYLCAHGCSDAKVTVIPPSADEALLDIPLAPTRADAPRVVYTGNLDAYQNLPFLVRAMEQVRKAIPGATLVVATADPRDLPGAQKVFVPDFGSLRRILAEDVVVACPRVSWCGYPIKLLNAMAAGKPVVACRSAAYPMTNEQDGLVVEDNDTAAFAAALVRLLTDPELRHRLGATARTTVKTRHAPTTIAAAIAAVYDSAGLQDSE